MRKDSKGIKDKLSFKGQSAAPLLIFHLRNYTWPNSNVQFLIAFKLNCLKEILLNKFLVETSKKELRSFPEEESVTVGLG